nr:type IV pilus biogenesis protein PilP [Aromatoleum evansii]
MRNKCIVLAAALCAAVSAHAGNYTARELLEVQSETAYLKAKTDLAKARNDLASAQGSSPNEKGAPQIVGIMRFGGDISARLRLADGAPIEVKQGDRLPDGSVVSEIRANGVRIKKQGDTKELAFVSGEQAAAPSTGQMPQIPAYGLK